MVPTKRFIRNAAIISISVMAAMELVIFWLMPYPVWSFETLIAELFVIGAASVGALIGWLVLRAMYPQLRGKTENMVESIKEQLELEKKEGIEYTLNNEDILAFNIYNQEHSPRAGRARRLLRRLLLVTIALEIMVAITLFTFFNERFLYVVYIVCVFILFTFLWWLFSPMLMRKALKGAIERNLDLNKNKLTGKHQITISPDAVTDTTDMGESTTRWNAIEYIASTDKYLFIVVRGSGPHIVPRRAFASEEAFMQFIEASKAYHQATI